MVLGRRGMAQAAVAAEGRRRDHFQNQKGPFAASQGPGPVSCTQSRLVPPQTKGAADQSAAPSSSREKNLLQVGHRSQVSRELGDAGRTAPAGAEAARIDRRNEGRADVSGGIVAGVDLSLIHISEPTRQAEI